MENGFGTPEDLEHIEDEGAIPGSDPDQVSDRAIHRGRDQVGTVGSGNHFVEVGEVEEVYDRMRLQEAWVWRRGWSPSSSIPDPGAWDTRSVTTTWT